MKTRGLILILALLASACTEKGKPIYKHDPARPQSTSPGINNPPAAEQAADPKGLSLQQLADRVLDLNRVRDPRSLESRQVRDELIALNRMILDASPEAQAHIEFKTIMSRYTQALFTDCNGFFDGCTGIKYFDRVPSSSQVAKWIAKNDNANRFKLILAALKLKGVEWDQEAAELLLNRPEGKLSPEEAKYADAAQNQLETALQSIQHRSQDRQENRRFLESINAWRLVAKREWARSDAGGNSLITMLAETGMMYTADGKQLHPEFKKLVAAQAETENGYMAQQKLLRAQKDFKMEGVGVEFRPEMDEVLYIIDAVYTGKLSADAGVSLFAATRASGADLEKAAQNYLRVQFVTALHESTRMAVEIFNAKVRVEDLLKHAMRESTAVQRVWSTFRGRVLPLNTFVVTAARARPDYQASQKRLRLLFESVDNSIRLTSLFPHELVLFHLMSQKNFQIDVGYSTYNSADLFRLLFEEQIPALFPYVEGAQTANQLELLSAVDMALRTNLVQAAGIDPDYFMSDIARRLSQRPQLNIDQVHARIVRAFGQNSTYNEFKNACEEFRSGRLIRRRHYFMDSLASPYYGQLARSAFISITSDAAAPSGRPPLMYIDKAYSEMLESTRLDLSNSLRVANAFLVSLRGYLKQAGLDNKKIDERTKLLREEIARQEEFRRKVLENSRTWYNDIGLCFWPAAARDGEIAEKNLLAEQAYLRSVHAKIKRLRQGNLSPEQAGQIKNSVRLTGLPDNFQGYDEISESGYTYSNIDLAVRVSRYMQFGLQTEKETIAPIAPHVESHFGRKLNIDMPILREAKRRTLPYTENETDFVNAGMQILFKTGSGEAMVQWFADYNMAVTYWDNVLRSLVSLHRMEHEVGGKQSIEPKDLLQTQEAILKFINISPVQRDLFTVIRRSKKFDPITFDYRVLRYDIEQLRTQTTWGVFDLPYRLMQEEVLGDAWDALSGGPAGALLPMRLSYTTAGKMYYRVRANRSLTVVPYNQEQDQFIANSIRHFITSEVTAIKNFQEKAQNYIAEVRKLPAEQRPHVDINMFTSYAEPLLDPNVIRTWDYKMLIFNQTTAHCFVPGKTCAEFGEMPGNK